MFEPCSLHIRSAMHINCSLLQCKKNPGENRKYSQKIHFSGAFLPDMYGNNCSRLLHISAPPLEYDHITGRTLHRSVKAAGNESLT